MNQTNFEQWLESVCCIEDLAVLSYGFIFEEFNGSKESEYVPENYSELEKSISTFFENIDHNYKYALDILKDKLRRMNKKHSFGFCEFYGIIKNIDINYVYTPNHMNFGFDYFYEYESLSVSSNEPDIFLIPKMKSDFIKTFDKALKEQELKSSRKKRGLRKQKIYDNNSINAYLKNIILVHKKDINGYSLCIHEYSANNSSKKFNDRINENCRLKFLLVPLTAKKPEEILDIAYDDKYFWIEKVKEQEEDILLNNYIKIIQKYNDSDVDFVVFPEMFLTEKIISNVSEYLKNNFNEESFKIYVLGTIWKDFSNKAVVMSSDGEIIYTQNKKVSFKHEKTKLYEKLLNVGIESQKIHVIDLCGVSRIMTFVCKEIDDGKMMSIPQILGSSLLIAPSFSESLNMMVHPKAIAEGICCVTVMANACSFRYNEKAIDSKRDIGFICEPAKNGTFSGYQVLNYTFKDKCINCNKEGCSGFIISINFDEPMGTEIKSMKTTIKKE